MSVISRGSAHCAFRVCLIVPPGRVRYVQRLVAQEAYDFVLTSTFDLLKDGFGRPVWSTNEGMMVNLLGRGDVLGGFGQGLSRVAAPPAGARQLVQYQ